MTNSNLIPVFNGQITNLPTQLCNARELHTFLKVGKVFGAWIQERINDYGFIENEDYIVVSEKTTRRPRKEYHITLDMGKELAMVERNEKGRQIRKYFIECEKRALAQSQPRLDTIASPEQKQKIKNAVSAATHLTGKPYQYVYTMLFNYLGINELAELKAHDFDRAMRYIDNWDFQSPKQSLTTPPATRLFPNAGRYLVVTDHNGNITRLQQLQDESIVNAEAYRKLRQDMYATENLLKELRCRMTMVEGQASLSRLDTPILTSVNQ